MTTSELRAISAVDRQSLETTDVARLSMAPRSQLQLELRRLSRHRLAMAGLAGILLMTAAALLAPWLAPYPYDEQHLDFIRVAPSAQFFFGTDSLGRDLLSRVLHGARMALLIGLIVVTIETVIGVCLGMAAGYFRGYTDLAVSFVSDVFWAFPPLVLVLGVVAAVGPSLVNVAVALALISWAPFARVTRAKVMTLRQRDFVQASVAIGASHVRILQWHLLPNLVATNLVLVMLTLPGALLTVSALSFLGFGVQPPTADWGAMLNEGRPYLQEAPWIATFPGLAILLTVVCFNLLGEGVRDAFDPRQKV